MSKKETGTRGEAKGMPLTIKGRRVSKDYLIENGIINDWGAMPVKKDDDTINRQAAIDTICKVCSIVEDYHKCNGYPETSTWCDELVALRALPSAQPEIIFCKDCKHWEQESICEGYCSEIEKGGFDEDHFCSFAERRTDEADYRKE